MLSECATIQKEHGNAHESLYIIPNSDDRYFQYALKYILMDPNNETYNKLYVVSLNFDHKDYESFKYINCYTRCVLKIRQFSGVFFREFLAKKNASNQTVIIEKYVSVWFGGL